MSSVYHVSKYVLSTHPALNPDDIEFAANYIANSNPTPRDVLSKQNLIQFLVYSNKNTICRFALTFNDELDRVIIARDLLELNALMNSSPDVFVELYDNPRLHPEEQTLVYSSLARLQYATKLVLDGIREEHNIESIDLVGYCSSCYNYSCMEYCEASGLDPISSQMSQYNEVPRYIYAVDHAPGVRNIGVNIPPNPFKTSSSRNNQTCNTPMSYCFDVLDIVASLATTGPTHGYNPQSQQPMSRYAYQTLSQRFAKEIKMYKRYLIGA